VSLAWLVLCSGCDLVFPLKSPDTAIDARLDGCPEGFHGTHLYVANPISWLAAEVDCENRDPDTTDAKFTHLAILSTLGEIPDFEVPVGAQAWVGLTNGRFTTGTMPPLKNEFEWITTELTIPVPWGASQPNSTSQPPLGGTIEDDFQIHDSGSNMHPYICECDTLPAVVDRVNPP